MKIRNGLLFAVLFVFAVVFVGCGGGGGSSSGGAGGGTTTFTVGDLQGTWISHALASGDSPEWTGWSYATVIFDNTGNGTFSGGTDSDGGPPANGNYSLSIDANGTVTMAGEPSLHGVMSLDKKLISLTVDDSTGGAVLAVLQKVSGTFNLSDLAGTWNFHALVSGDDPALMGWRYGQGIADANGDVTLTSINETVGLGGGSPGDVMSLTIDANGIVGQVGFVSLHGAMNSAKDLMVTTLDDDDGGYSLMLSQKAGGTYSLSDLQGNWSMHTLVSGDSPQFTGWSHFEGAIDGAGNMTFTLATRSDGDSTVPGASAVAITASGVFTVTSNPSLSGQMSKDKNLIVAVSDNPTAGGYVMAILQKRK